jgi:hypothetical protein
MRIITAACCLALLLAGCAAARQESLPPESAAQLELEDPSGAERTASEAELNVAKVRCRTERVAGSNIPKRICLTDAEWAEVREVSQRAYDQLKRPMNAPPESQ